MFLGYIGILQHKEHPPEVWSVPPVTPCIINQQDATLAVLCLLIIAGMLINTILPELHLVGLLYIVDL